MQRETQPGGDTRLREQNVFGSLTEVVVPRMLMLADDSACINCHRRKVRCDMGKCGTPCTNCKSRGQSSECREHQKKTRRDLTTATFTPRPLLPVARRSQRHSEMPVASDNENDPGNLADLFNREEVRSASIGHRGRMCFVGSDASNFNYLVRQSIRGPPQPGMCHFATRQFHHRHTALDVHNVPAEALLREHKTVESRLLDAYFDRVNPGWPIIDEEYFMKQYQEDSFHNPLPLPLLNAILLVGAHTLASEDESLQPLIAVFFRRAKVLIEYRFEQDRTLYVQAALLMTWYSDGHEDILANTWHWIGFACRIAIGHGMHRDTTNSKMLECHKRTWTRLWWVLFQFDTILSASYGRPQVM